MPLPLDLADYEQTASRMTAILKEYHRVKDNPTELRNFYRSLDRDFVLGSSIYIPGYTKEVPSYLDDTFLRHNQAAAVHHLNYWPMYTHAHSFVEMIYTGSGSCHNIADDGVLNLTAGDLLIIPPNLRHAVFANSGGVIINLIFTVDYLRNYYSAVFRQNCPINDFFADIMMGKPPTKCLLCHVEDNAPFYNLAELMLNESLHRANSDILNDLLILIFRLIHREAQVSTPGNVLGSRTMYDIFHILQEDFSHITLQMLSERLHFSPDYIGRLIKSATGKTFSDLLLEIRMKHACFLLGRSNLPVREIAIQCGYAYSDQFYKRFKVYTGVTPAEYRARERSAEWQTDFDI